MANKRLLFCFETRKCRRRAASEVPKQNQQHKTNWERIDAHTRLVAVAVIIRMFVAPLPVLRLFFTLQLGEFPMGFVLALLPGLVGTIFVVVPSMAILTVAVIPVFGAIAIPIPIFNRAGLNAHGRDQGRTQQKRN
jgi:hypothetical protein